MQSAFSTITTIMAVLQAGIDLYDRASEAGSQSDAVAFHLAARSFGFTAYGNPRGLYAEVTVTNKSEAPYTVGGFELELDTGAEEPRRLESEPVLQVTAGNADATAPAIETTQGHYHFEDVKLWRSQGFPDLAYLEPAQAKAGVVVFRLPEELGTIAGARLRLGVSGYNYDVTQDLL